MSNTLRMVRAHDLVDFKDALDVFVSWYVRNCEKIADFAAVWGESPDDTLTGILSAGMQEYEKRTDIIKEADRMEAKE